MIRTVLLCLSLLSFAACGGEDDAATADSSANVAPVALGPDGKPAPTTSPEIAGPPPVCLSASEVSAAAGMKVIAFPQGSRTYGTRTVCAYQGADSSQGVFVTTMVAPADGADELFAKTTASAALALGAGGAPDSLTLGDRGLAFGAASKSEAIAVAGDRVIQAEVVSSGSANLADRKAGMIALVRQLIGR